MKTDIKPVPVNGTKAYLNGQEIRGVVHFRQDYRDKCTLQVLYEKDYQEWSPGEYKLELELLGGERRDFMIQIFKAVSELICDNVIRVIYLVTIV